MVLGVLEFIIIFLVSFFIIQYRVENFIYKRIKKIYDDVSLLEKSDSWASKNNDGYGNSY